MPYRIRLITRYRHIVIHPQFKRVPPSASSSKSGSPSYYNSSRECTYGYNCSFTGDGKPTLMTVFDISDLSKPVKVREVLGLIPGTDDEEE